MNGLLDALGCPICGLDMAALIAAQRKIHRRILVKDGLLLLRARRKENKKERKKTKERTKERKKKERVCGSEYKQ